MILIAANAEWPEEQYVDKLTGMPLERLRSARYIVYEGISIWMRRTGGMSPSHLLVPLRLKNDFQASLQWTEVMMMKPMFPKQDRDEFLGLTLHFVGAGPMELLGNLSE